MPACRPAWSTSAQARLPISYGDDRAAAETILLDAARRHAVRQDQLDHGHGRELTRRHGISIGDVAKVYWRLTDNWLEPTVRFLSPDHGTRAIKDALSREILHGLDAKRIGIDSATYQMTGLPVLRVTGDGMQVRP